jgi:hypothetical protein
MMAGMITLILIGLLRGVRTQRSLVLENLALRHQLAVLQRTAPRPRFRTCDRLLWVLLSHLWRGWNDAISVVQPATVIRWQRTGFKLFWARKSRRNGPGRPAVAPEVRALIRHMSRANPLGRIHGELRKLGIQIAQATVSKYLGRPNRAPSQTWRTFLDNHRRTLVSVDFFVVPTVLFLSPARCSDPGSLACSARDQCPRSARGDAPDRQPPRSLEASRSTQDG